MLAARYHSVGLLTSSLFSTYSRVRLLAIFQPEWQHQTSTDKLSCEWLRFTNSIAGDTHSQAKSRLQGNFGRICRHQTETATKFNANSSIAPTPLVTPLSQGLIDLPLSFWRMLNGSSTISLTLASCGHPQVDGHRYCVLYRSRNMQTVTPLWGLPRTQRHHLAQPLPPLSYTRIH